MNVGSLFTGIGGFDLGLERAGHTIQWQCEADEWRRGVLAAHWPGVDCSLDVRDVGTGSARGQSSQRRDGAASQAEQRSRNAVGLVCGGFPCQDLSVAGRRAGLAGERSGLFYEFARVADVVLPPGGWLLLENVPGLLSSQGGRDYAVVLATLADLGFHDLAWRVLDSRHFGVAQRRRRVYILARRARGDRACQVLLEPESGGGDPQTSGEAGPGVAVASLSGLGSGGPDDNDSPAGRIVTADTLTSGSHPASNMPGRRREDDTNIVAATLKLEKGRGWATSAEAADNLQVYPLARRGREGGSELEVGEEGTYNALRAGNGGSSRLNQVMVGTGVRRLTPVECERLQGFPDGWTAYGPDSRRYAALGDAVTVNVAEWIGRRLLETA